MASNSDPMLVDISNAFFTGNYQHCISLSEKIKVNKNILVIDRKLPAHQIQFSILETMSGTRYLHVSVIFGYEPISCCYG